MLAPLFLQAARRLRSAQPELSLVMPAANAARETELRQLLEEYPDLPVNLVSGRSREVMAAATAVLLASGTATLEAALLKRPMVVAYRMGALSWWLITRLVHTEYAALPNVLAGRALVPELLQDAASPQALADAVAPLLGGGSDAAEQLQAFDAMHRELARDYASTCAEALLELLGSSADRG